MTDKGKTLQVVAASPDDLVLGCGAAVRLVRMAGGVTGRLASGDIAGSEAKVRRARVYPYA